MPRFLRQLIDLWNQLGLNQKISLALAALAVVGVMAGILTWSARPDLQPINIGGPLDPKDAGEITAELDARGVKYEISGGGGTILVPRDQVYKLRMELAAKGAFSGGAVGFEIFDKGNFGISDFVQRTNSLRAIQGELARTISQINGVRSARVMVVMPENRLLVTDTNRRSTASVLVDTGGSRLATEAVNSIRSLVAYAVEGLKVDDVVVVDNRGNVLSEELRQDNTTLGLTAGQMRYRTGLEEYYSDKVESMLSTVLGPGNAVVRVSVDVDHTSSTTVEERYDPDTQVVRNTTVTEDSNVSSEARPSGVVGTTANAPGEAGAANNTPPVTTSQQTRKSKTESYEIGRSTTNTVKNAGEIRRVSAAVFVALRTTGTGDARQPQPRTPEEIAALRTMVVNALGVAPSRAPGAAADQVVSIQEVDFATDPLVAPEVLPQAVTERDRWIDFGERALVVVAALVVLLLFVRVLRRSQAEAASLEVYNGGAGGGRGRPMELDGEITPELLNQLIRQKPDNVGLTLKRWMSAEQK
jgi:flagellar M-ring protein FliF